MVGSATAPPPRPASPSLATPPAPRRFPRATAPAIRAVGPKLAKFGVRILATVVARRILGVLAAVVALSRRLGVPPRRRRGRAAAAAAAGERPAPLRLEPPLPKLDEKQLFGRTQGRGSWVAGPPPLACVERLGWRGEGWLGEMVGG